MPEKLNTAQPKIKLERYGSLISSLNVHSPFNIDFMLEHYFPKAIPIESLTASAMSYWSIPGYVFIPSYKVSFAAMGKNNLVQKKLELGSPSIPYRYEYKIF